MYDDAYIIIIIKFQWQKQQLTAAVKSLLRTEGALWWIVWRHK